MKRMKNESTVGREELKNEGKSKMKVRYDGKGEVEE